MATVTTANRQEQYLNLRRKLTDLNYTETFGIEYVIKSLDCFQYSIVI